MTETTQVTPNVATVEASFSSHLDTQNTPATKENSLVVNYLMNNRIEWTKSLNTLNNRLLRIVQTISQDLATMSKRDSPLPQNERDLLYRSWVDYTRSKIGMGRVWSKGFVNAVIRQYILSLKEQVAKEAETAKATEGKTVVNAEPISETTSMVSDFSASNPPLPI